MTGHKRANSDAVVDRVEDLHHIADAHAAALPYESVPHENLPEIGDFIVPGDFSYPGIGESGQQFTEPGGNQSPNEPELPSLADTPGTSITDVEEDSHRLTLRQGLNDRRLLLAGLACSLLLHYSLGGVLINFELDEHLVDLPTIVKISLLPKNPLGEEEVVEVVEEAIEDEPSVEAFAEVETESTVATPVEPEPLLEPQEELQLAEELIREIVEEPVPAPIVVPPVLVVPTTAEVVRSIESIENENTSRLWAFDCNARQEESDHITCDRQASPNYDAARENSTYRSLNPTWQVSRSLRTLTTVAKNSSNLAASLRGAQIPEGLSAYLMEEVEAGITHNSDLGNWTLHNIEIMTDKSDSEKYFRETQTDPWRNPLLMTRFKERQQRNVHEQN